MLKRQLLDFSSCTYLFPYIHPYMPHQTSQAQVGSSRGVNIKVILRYNICSMVRANGPNMGRNYMLASM